MQNARELGTVDFSRSEYFNVNGREWDNNTSTTLKRKF